MLVHQVQALRQIVEAPARKVEKPACVSRHYLTVSIAPQNAEGLLGSYLVVTNVVGREQGRPAVAVLLVYRNQFRQGGKRQRDAARAGRCVGALKEPAEQIGGAIVYRQLAK